MFLRRWFRADEHATDDLGWTANLAIFRIAFLALAVLPFAIQVTRWTTDILPSIESGAWAPISFYRCIPLWILSNAPAAHAIAIADLIVISLGLVGFYTRPSLALATVLSLYLFGLPENQGKVFHFHHLIWFMAMLAAGPSDALLSVDAIVRAVRRADRGEVALEVPRGAALAALRWVWVLLGLLYLGAGLGKLRSALRDGWISAENLRHVVWENWFERRRYAPGFSPPVRFDRLPAALIDFLGVATVAVESIFLFLVLFRGSRWFLIAAGLAFHAGNGALLGIWFTTLMAAYVAMVDWTWLARRALKFARREQVVVLYDGSCELCRRTIAILKTLDMCGALLPVPGLCDDPRRRAHPEITDAMLLRDLYAVANGGVAGGYDAYKTISAVIPALWPLSLIMRLPPIAAVGARIYRGVAESRHCPIERPLPAAATSPIAARWLSVRIVGVFLVLAEAFAIGMHAVIPAHPAQSDLGVDRPASMVSRIGAAYRGAHLTWPFDLYPTFAGDNAGAYRCFEFALVSIDGVETAVPPQVFARAFGDWAAAAEDMLEAASDADPSRRRALALARMLWSKTPQHARQGVIAIRGYDAIYSTDPENPCAISRKLIDNFPVNTFNSTSEPIRSNAPDAAIVEVRP